MSRIYSAEGGDKSGLAHFRERLRGQPPPEWLRQRSRLESRSTMTYQVKRRDIVAHKIANFVLNLVASKEYVDGLNEIYNNGLKVKSAIKPVKIRTEWVKISNNPRGTSSGWITRAALEEIGVNTKPLDHCHGQTGVPCPNNPHECDKPYHRQGTVWLNHDQSEAIRKHRDWRPGDTFEEAVGA